MVARRSCSRVQALGGDGSAVNGRLDHVRKRLQAALVLMVVTLLATACDTSHPSSAKAPVDRTVASQNENRILGRTPNIDPRLRPLGLRGRQTYSLRADPQRPGTVYALVAPGDVTYRSTDSGGHWGRLRTAVGAPGMRLLAIDPSRPTTLYASEGDGILKSVNDGVTWTSLRGASRLCRGGGADAVAIDPTRASALYVACTETRETGRYAQLGPLPVPLYEQRAHIFRTANDGRTWHRAKRDPIGKVRVLVVDAHHRSILYVGSESGIRARSLFRSTDSGRSWHAARLAGQTWDIAVNANTSVVYALTDDLRRSRDGGRTWQRLDPGGKDLGVTAIARDPRKSDVVYAATWHSLSPFRALLFRSDDGGESWAEVVRATGPMRDGSPFTFDALAVDTAGTVYVGTADGVFAVNP